MDTSYQVSASKHNLINLIKYVSLEGFKTLGSVSVSGQGIPIPDGSWVE
jgi:hypothetical protein